MRLNLYENSPPVVGFEMLPDFLLLQVLSLLYFFSSCDEPLIHLNLQVLSVFQL